MNNKEANRLSRRDAVKYNLRAFQTIYATRKKVLALRMRKLAFAALTPYLGIRLSALLLDELAGARDPHRLTALVLWIIGSAAVITLVQSLLDRWHDAEQAGMYIHISHLMSDKMRRMDFVDIDSPKTHALLSTIAQNQNGGGWGMHRVTHNFNNLWMAILQLGGGIAMTVSLFISRVPDSADKYTVLNSPFITVAVIALMLAVTYLAPMLSAYGGKLFAQHAGDHNLGNRLFGFYGWLGKREESAVDVRVYDLSGFCETYCLDKTATFSSKGPFAKIAKTKTGFLDAGSTVVGALFTGLVYLYVCVKGWAGAFGVGAITQYIGAVTLLAGSFRNLLAQLGDMRNNAAFLKLCFDFLDMPNTMEQGNLPVPKQNIHEIEFKNVSFRYPGSDTFALKNVSIRFRAGDRLAVVGQNGSGKTTFIKLLCRLYDPTEGEILLNGINIREYDYKDYLSVFSVVFQDFQTFALPLGQNVAGSTEYDRARAEQCLRDAGFGERLTDMPQGLDTYLYKYYETNGVDVSGGEAQKIALARTLYKDAPFIILDEPTAALDPIAESEIYASFHAIVGDKTALYISHRLSSCRFCNTVAVFDGGKLVQYGSHETLLNDRGGKYSELWNAQAQYYNEGEQV